MSADRTAMIRMASALPKGSPERRFGPVDIHEWKRSDEAGRARILREQVERAMTIMSMAKIMAESTEHPQERAIADVYWKIENLLYRVL